MVAFWGKNQKQPTRILKHGDFNNLHVAIDLLASCSLAMKNDSIFAKLRHIEPSVYKIAKRTFRIIF